jgi:hypothetical protein
VRQLSAIFPDNGYGVVGRAVVADDQTEIVKGLSNKGIQKRPQEILAVIDGQQDIDDRAAHNSDAAG